MQNFCLALLRKLRLLMQRKVHHNLPQASKGSSSIAYSQICFAATSIFMVAAAAAAPYHHG